MFSSLSTRIKIAAFFTILVSIILTLFFGGILFSYHHNWKEEVQKDLTEKGYTQEQYQEEVTHFQHEEEEFIQTFLFLIALSSLFIFATGYTFAWKILQPIREISKNTQKISLQNLSKRLLVEGKENDEIRVLSQNLNTMLARLEKSAQKLTQFTQDASHELRTPLSIIDTSLQLALKTQNFDKIQDAQQDVKNMSNLIDSLLLLAQHEEKQFSEEEKEKFFLFKECTEISENIAKKYQKKNVSLRLDIPENFFWRGEKNSLKRVLINLIENAYKFSPQDGEILCTVDKKVFSIQNIGKISEEEQEKIFTRFFRTDSSKSSEGAGLGLAITKSLLEANGKEISVLCSDNTVVFTIS